VTQACTEIPFVTMSIGGKCCLYYCDGLELEKCYLGKIYLYQLVEIKKRQDAKI
jgi:hypothetical protein